MKMAFHQIKERLEDPFFELGLLGKVALRQRIQPMNKYAETPSNLQFEDWTPEDDRQPVQYSFADTEIGRLLIADDSKGVCFLGFAGDCDAAAMEDFRNRFPRHNLEERTGDFQRLAIGYCNGNRVHTVPLHVKGTRFQTDIWKKLVRIPEGALSTYASLTGDPKNSRAAGSAVGANPVSYIIPCHRVVRSDGSFHGYHWGLEIKRQLLAYELS